jgi:Mg2+ and Co2+ transporter CorA
MKMFSNVSILFLPPGAVAGIMGMNVRVPWNEYEESLVPFFCLLIFTVIWCVGMYGWIVY